MLNLKFLQEVLQCESAVVSDPEKQVIESAAGYDGIVSLVQTKGITPMVVLEHNSVGELSFRPGGFQNASQSIWIMKMVGRNANRQEVQDSCVEDMKTIVSLLMKYKGYPQVVGWQPESIPYSVRNAGPNFTGYEFTLHFAEDINLFYNG